MKLNHRSLVVAVLLFTAAAVAMLWVLSQRWQDEMRTQVLNRAEQRSLQLAGAMAGQVAAELVLLDQTLVNVRSALQRDPLAIELLSEQSLKALPMGLVSHLSVVDAEGLVTYSSLSKGVGVDISDQIHFQRTQTGQDQLVIEVPVVCRLTGKWLVPVGRRLVDGSGKSRGGIFLLVSSDFLAQRMQEMAGDKNDIVSLIHPSGQFLAHGQLNSAAMGKMVPKDRPYLAPDSGAFGNFRQRGTIDGVARIFGWQRVKGSGVVVTVGLAESSVMAPMVSTLNRLHWVTGLLSLMLVAAGGSVAWFLRRIEQSGQAVSESEERLKEGQQLAKIGHWALDHRNGELNCSDEVYRIFEWTRGVDRPSFWGFVARVHPDDQKRVSARYEEAIKSEDSLEVVHRIVMADGSTKHLRELCVFDRVDGRLVSTRGTVQDITEVREAQLALEQMNNELEAHVASRTRDLKILNNELETFAYSVSHDLRTPLRSIHGFASLLGEERDTLSAEGRSHLHRIQEGARRMGQLITDLLTMAHHSRTAVNVQRVDLSELAQGVMVELERNEKKRAVQWTVEPGLWGFADPGLMRVVLQNLLGNAWKYTNQTAQAEVSLRQTGQSGRLAEFCVRDNGAGFDMAYVDQLFQPFKRLHAQHEFEGSGVGLASVLRLVQRHGGTVRAEGAPGQGAAFYFTLPSEPEAALPFEARGAEGK